MASKIVKFALSIVTLSPLLFFSLSPVNAQTSAAKAEKTGVHTSMQEHSQNTHAMKPIKSANSQSSAAPVKKLNTHISNQKHSQNAHATKQPMQTNTAVSKPKKVVSYSHQTAPTLRLGSKGKAVKDIQEFLKAQKLYNGATDGVYNNNTRSAIIAFQKSHNLKADGIVGAKTWSAVHH